MHDRPCVDRLDEATRIDAPPRPPTPRWRIILHLAATASLTATVIAHILRWTLDTFPAEVTSVSRAVTAVLCAAVLGSLAADRLVVAAVRAIRGDIDDLTRRVESLHEHLDTALNQAYWRGRADQAIDSETTPAAPLISLPRGNTPARNGTRR